MFLFKLIIVILLFAASPALSMKASPEIYNTAYDAAFEARLQELEICLLKMQEAKEATKELNAILNKPKYIKPVIVNRSK